MELWGDDIFVDAKSESDEDEASRGLAGIPALPTVGEMDIDGGGDSNTRGGGGESEEGDLRILPDLLTADATGVDGCLDPDAVSKQCGEANHDPEIDSEEPQSVQIGYGAQFQGQRAYQGDESEESEEE